MIKLIIATLSATIILFLWSGAAQMLPWGVPATTKISTDNTAGNSNVKNLKVLSPGTLTTERFETEFNNRISTYTTGKTFSWIVMQPLKKDYSVYFIKEAMTQLIIGLFLSVILLMTIDLSLQKRMILIVLAAASASFATYGQLMNWWGIPASYGVGVSVNLIIGWLLAGFIIARFVFKSQKV